MGTGQKIVDASKAGLRTLEERLSGVLRPIHPRREFVRGLGQRIQAPSPAALIDRPPDLRLIILALTGLFSLSLLVAVLIRYFASPRRSSQRQA
ncbi:MAG: hypothetical protein ABWK53_13190 [Anaerolineales bacterium]